jgi:deoxyribodipyrimidine photo-lyase
VLPVFCLDPATFDEGTFGLQRTGPRRTRFLLESLADLRASLRGLGGDLLVVRAPPGDAIPALADRLDATVHYQRLPGTEERADERAVERDCPATEAHWTHTLYHPEDLPTPVAEMDDTFTPWREETEEGAGVRETVEAPEGLETPPVELGDLTGGWGAVPTLAELGLDPVVAADDDWGLALRGGARAGRERFREWAWEGDNLRRYVETRNGLLGTDYSSKLSAYLAHGCLSPRWVHAEVKDYEAERVANNSTYWLVFELLWRDFFQFQLSKHGRQFFTAGGIRTLDREWTGGDDAFRRWCRGETGVPFVDANMRELNATGYMSNRGRQNVASFLADVLGVDWRRGAAYFEARLVDYDVAANWGNWAYVAGVGNDSRDSYFHVLKQAREYDPDAAYVRRWLPVFEGVPAEAAHEPWTMSADQQRAFGVVLGEEYPRPVVDVEAAYDRLRSE